MPGANLNALLDENLRDPLSGNSVLSGVPVRLEPEHGRGRHYAQPVIERGGARLRRWAAFYTHVLNRRGRGGLSSIDFL
jgi:hypothetical protein